MGGGSAVLLKSVPNIVSARVCIWGGAVRISAPHSWSCSHLLFHIASMGFTICTVKEILCP